MKPLCNLIILIAKYENEYCVAKHSCLQVRLRVNVVCPQWEEWPGNMRVGLGFA